MFYDELVTPEILDRARRDAERVFVGKRRGQPGIGQDEINARLVEAARAGRDVVRLKGGDPFVFGRGGEELEHLRAAGVPVVVVPGITAALGCAAEAGLPLTFRNEASRLTFVTAHRADDAAAIDWSGLGDPQTTVVVYMGLASAAAVRDGLIAAGRDPRNAGRRAGARHAARCDRRPSGASTISRRSPRAAGEGPALLVIGDVVARSTPWRRADRSVGRDARPHDLAAATEAQDHRPGRGHREPAERRRRRLSHADGDWTTELAAGGRRDHGAGGDRAARRPRSADDVGAVGAYVAPVQARRGQARAAGQSARAHPLHRARPSICRASARGSEPCTSTTNSTARLVDRACRRVPRPGARAASSGELTEDEFKPLRLMNGVYLQLHAYMLRIAIPYGTLSSEQLRTLAHVARRYDRDYGHFTTRQNIQFNWIKLEELPDAMADLARAGTARHADQRQLRPQHHHRPMGRRRAGRDRGPAHLGRDPAPAPDAASGILVPAAQVQDRGDRRRRTTAPR